MAILELPSFERFVFVMSVLERFSIQECSLLLGCTRRDVIAAQTRALQQMGNSIHLNSTKRLSKPMTGPNHAD
jgi:DNA-directed RNA polymerase specialized sigma24 family protein